MTEQNEPLQRYRVYLKATVSTSIVVEAEDEDAAVDAAYNSNRNLGLIFLDHQFPDVGDWEDCGTDLLP